MILRAEVGNPFHALFVIIFVNIYKLDIQIVCIHFLKSAGVLCELPRCELLCLFCGNSHHGNSHSNATAHLAAPIVRVHPAAPIVRVHLGAA